MDLTLDYSTFHVADELAACYQAYVGHELPNQLVAIQAYARLVLEDEADRLSEDGRMMLGLLAGLTRRADQFARRIAEIGRLLREPAGGSAILVDSLVREAFADVERMSRRRDISYEITGTGKVALAPSLLYRVLFELLENAARAIPSERTGKILIEVSQDSASCRITIRDNGCGINDKQVLLEPFAAARHPGTDRPGLGFFFVRQLVAQRRGRVEIKSQPGDTDISLFFPTES